MYAYISWSFSYYQGSALFPDGIAFQWGYWPRPRPKDWEHGPGEASSGYPEKNNISNHLYSIYHFSWNDFLGFIGSQPTPYIIALIRPLFRPKRRFYKKRFLPPNERPKRLRNRGGWVEMWEAHCWSRISCFSLNAGCLKKRMQKVFCEPKLQFGDAVTQN